MTKAWSRPLRAVTVLAAAGIYSDRTGGHLHAWVVSQLGG